MTFIKGQIVRMDLGGIAAFGRVTKVDESGDGKAMFYNSANGHIIEATIMPEMVEEAFWFNGTGKYKV